VTTSRWLATRRSNERKEYLALMRGVYARRKGETVEVETTLIEEGEPTGEELPLDE
jgi:hypothetical protein